MEEVEADKTTPLVYSQRMTEVDTGEPFTLPNLTITSATPD